jgi:hypothetical protein
MMRVSDRLIYPSRANANDAFQGLRSALTDDPPQAIGSFLIDLEEACKEGGLDFSIAAAHGANESDWYRDPGAWQERNFFGIGHPDGAERGIVFDSFRAGARFYVGEMLLKLRKPIPPALADARSYAPKKWDQVEGVVGGAHGPFPIVRTIDDLNERFGPNDREAVWMTDPNGPRAIVAKSRVLFPDLPNQQGGTVPETRIPTIVLDAGHRSTDRSGNPAEMAMTDDLAIAYTAELRRRGFEAFWYQRDIDRDSDPDETIGTLNTVAKGLGAWLQSQSWALMLSLHYDGARSVLHAIVPDNVGLSTAYPEGRDPNDTAANNPLDRRLGVAIVDRMVRAGLGSPFHGSLGETGLMSERETGVGRQGYRLAVMSATAPSRVKAVRLVIEHGGTSDPAARRFSDFARAAADAIESVYGTPGGTTTTTTTAPPVTYPPKRVPAPDVIESQGYPLTINKPNRFYCTQGGHFKTAPSLDAPDATPTPYKANRRYTFDYAAVVDGEDWLVSKAGSWAPAKNFEE